MFRSPTEAPDKPLKCSESPTEAPVRLPKSYFVILAAGWAF